MQQTEFLAFKQTVKGSQAVAVAEHETVGESVLVQQG